MPLPPAKRISQITTISIAPLVGEAIKRIHRGESVGALFSSEISFTQEMLLWEDGVARTLDSRADLEAADGEATDGDNAEPAPAELASALRESDR